MPTVRPSSLSGLSPPPPAQVLAYRSVLCAVQMLLCTVRYWSSYSPMRCPGVWCYAVYGAVLRYRPTRSLRGVRYPCSLCCYQAPTSTAIAPTAPY
eukprot:3940745-Rhodomonas_salina.26